MKRLSILAGIALLGTGIVAGLSINASAEESLTIPSWIKNTAEFWVDGQISDAQFITALQFLVKEEILVIPVADQPESKPVVQDTVLIQDLPSQFEMDFQKTATPINLFLEYDGLEIELKSGGMFTYLKYNNWKDQATNYRIDVAITNTSNEYIVFSPSGSLLKTSDDRQFESNLLGTIERGRISAQSSVEGYILFEADDGEIVDQITSIVIDDYYIFDLERGQAFTSEQITEKEYNENALKVEKSIKRGDFEITLVKIGAYSKPYFNEIIDGLRVDFIIENVGRETEYIPYDIVILDGNGNQYDTSYHSEIEFKQIHPGVRYSGYAFFEDYYSDSSNIDVVITKYDYPRDFEWRWNIKSVPGINAG